MSRPGTQEKLAKARIKADQDLLWFAKRVCGFTDIQERPHRIFTDFITQPDPLKADKKRSIILAPRAHFKTSIATVAYPLWRLVKNPYEQILIGSFTQELARKFLQRIKSILDCPDEHYAVDGMPAKKMFRMLYGDWTVGKKEKSTWSLDAIQIPNWRTGQIVPFGTQNSIAVAGAGQQLASIHPTIAIFDDLVDEKTKKSKAAREAAWDFIRLVEPLVNPGVGHEIWLVGTRYSYEDIYGYVMEEFGNRYNILLAEMHGPVEIRPSYHFVQLPPIGTEYKDENFLWPLNEETGRGFDIKRDQELRDTMGADYWSQYHNRPWAVEKSKFKPELRRFFYLHEVYDEFKKEYKVPLHVTMTVDPNAEGQFKRDNAAISVAGVDSRGHLYILEAISGKWDWATTEIQIINTYRKWPKIALVAIEAQRIKNFVSRSFQETCRRLSVGYIPLFPFERKTTQSKNDRIETLIPPYNRLEIYLLAEETANGPKPIQTELIQEMDRWDPESKVNQDNLLDTLTDHYHPKLFHRPAAVSNKEQLYPHLDYVSRRVSEAYRKTKPGGRMKDLWDSAPELFV